MAKKAAPSKAAPPTTPKAAPPKAGKATKILPCVCDPEGRLKRVPLAALKRFQGNLKELRAEQYEKLKGAIESKGFIAPVFLWAGHDLLLDGHQRLNVLEREGWDVEGGIPVVEIEAADEKDAAEKLLLLSSTYGKIEPQGLYEFTSEHEIDLRDFELPDLPDFDLGAYVVEFYEGANGENVEDPGAQMDRAGELREKWGVQPGQLWALDRHKLICGDCTDAVVVERVMGGEQADLFISDPPYGVGYVEKAQYMADRYYGHSRATVARLIEGDETDKGGSDEAVAALLKDALSLWWPAYLKPGGVFYLCYPAGSRETTTLKVVSGLERIRQGLIWVKNNFVLGRNDYHYRHEPILYGWKAGAAHHVVEDRGLDTVWEIPRDEIDKVHPTMKPLALFERMIANSSDAGERVVDPFLGSGTSLLAAERLGRVFRGCELEPAYVAVALERWHQATGKTPTLELVEPLEPVAVGASPPSEP